MASAPATPPAAKMNTRLMSFWRSPTGDVSSIRSVLMPRRGGRRSAARRVEAIAASVVLVGEARSIAWQSMHSGLARSART